MCVVSFIGDNFSKRIQDDEYWRKLFNPPTTSPEPFVMPGPFPGTISINTNNVTREEFEILRREIEQLKELLKGAIEYDKRNNEPHCEIDEKVAILKKVAEAFGVDLTEVFKTK